MFNSIGSDMEVFGMTKDGHPTALCGMIGGTKEDPVQILGLPQGFMVQEDNVALEFNIPVCLTRSEFISSFRIMRQQTTKILNSLHLMLSLESSYSFDKSELIHPNALIFGCEPDYNAWSMKENRKPESIDPNLRTCGGHVHVGSDMDMVIGVRNMDLMLGVPSVLLDDKPSSIARRELYGKAGAMRPKPYGFEYRTLSNFWMFSDELVKWVYNQTYNSCNNTLNISISEGKRIQNCINTGNKKEAQEIINNYGISLPK